MEINIQIKNAQPEDLLQAFAALSGGSASSAPSAAPPTTGQGRPPLKRIRKEARATTAATRRSPSLLFSQEELRALQAANPQGVVQSSTDVAEDTETGQSAAGSGAKAKRKAQPFSAFRKHEGRTMSPRPYFQRSDQLGAGEAIAREEEACGLKIPKAQSYRARSQQLQTFQTEGDFKIQIAHSQDKISHSQDSETLEICRFYCAYSIQTTGIKGIGITFSKNIKQFRVNWRDIEIPQFPIHDSTKQYVDALCAAAEFRINSGVLLEHDLTWDRGGDASPETMRRFYFLQSSDLTLQDPPLPTRQEKILFWSHATDVGALWHMLKQRDMRPMMNAHGVAAFGCNIFYALGHEMSGSDIDEHNLTRVIFNTTRSAKNLAGIVVGGRAWGSLLKHLGGSYETARAATEEDEVLKDANAKAYCDSEHYDTNLVFKSTLRKNVEPTAWSRAKGLAGMDIRDVTVAHLCRHGMEEFGLRGLSHGKFTGMILTRNIAESVFLSQLQKKLRENNVDVDATVDAIYKSKSEKAPDKVKEATAFVTPLVDTIFDAIKPWAQVRNYAAKSADSDNQAAQRMQALEEQTAKYKPRLRSAGLEDILAEPHNVIRASGQEPPTSMTSIATWVANLKQSLPRDKHPEVDNHIQSMQTILENAKHTKAELQQMATRWGLPISLSTAPKASPKNLQQLIAAVT
ncbi:tauD [Symbiodinium sp. CCMP2592]|nr:tauD [Symbiodinium sp. CCMP2592]